MRLRKNHTKLWKVASLFFVNFLLQTTSAFALGNVAPNLFICLVTVLLVKGFGGSKILWVATFFVFLSDQCLTTEPPVTWIPFLLTSLILYGATCRINLNNRLLLPIGIIGATICYYLLLWIFAGLLAHDPGFVSVVKKLTACSVYNLAVTLILNRLVKEKR